MKNASFLKLRSFFDLTLFVVFLFILSSCAAFRRELPEEKGDLVPKKYKEIYKIKVPKQAKKEKKPVKGNVSTPEVKKEAPFQENSLLTPGETLIYNGSWAFVSVGTAEVAIQPQVMINEIPSHHVHVVAKTNEFFSSIYNTETHVDLYLNAETLKPYKFELNSRESKFIRNHVTLFDYMKNKASYWSKTIKLGKKKKEKIHDLEYGLIDNLFDMLSPAFQAKKWVLNEGKKIDFYVLENEKIYKIQCEVIKKAKKEVLKKMEDAFYTECLAKTFKTKKWEEKDQKEHRLWAWFSADSKHLLIEAGAKLTVGSVSLQLVDRK